MPNELDMDSYHSEGIDPGEHKTFNISPTIHSFNERFTGEPSVSAGPGPEAYDPNKMPDWWVKVLKPMRPDWPTDTGPKTLTNRGVDKSYEEPFVLPSLDKGGYQPIGFKETQQELHPYLKALRDAGVQYIENMSQQMKDALVDTIKHPENLIGPGELGMARARPSGFNEIRSSVEAMAKLKDLIAQGKTYSEIAAEFGVTKNKIAGLMNRVNLKGQSTHPKRTLKSYQAPEGEEPYTPPISGAKGDPEYEKTLSDWMKNQFEGGPIESEIGRNPKHWNDIEDIRGWDNEEKLLKQRQRQIQYDRKLSGTQDEPSGELERIRTRLRELK